MRSVVSTSSVRAAPRGLVRSFQERMPRQGRGPPVHGAQVVSAHVGPMLEELLPSRPCRKAG